MGGYSYREGKSWRQPCFFCILWLGPLGFSQGKEGKEREAPLKRQFASLLSPMATGCLILLSIGSTHVPLLGQMAGQRHNWNNSTSLPDSLSSLWCTLMASVPQQTVRESRSHARHGSAECLFWLRAGSQTAPIRESISSGTAQTMLSVFDLLAAAVLVVPWTVPIWSKFIWSQDPIEVCITGTCASHLGDMILVAVQQAIAS